MGSDRSTWRAWWPALVGAAMTLAAPAALAIGTVGTGWWWGGTDVDVARDGRPHDVLLAGEGAYAVWGDVTTSDPDCELLTRSGHTLPVRTVPWAERSVIELPGDADPMASHLFEAPSDGFLRVTCDAIDSVHVATVGLGPTVDPGTASAIAWSELLAGPALLAIGLALVAVGALRSRRGRPAYVGRRMSDVERSDDRRGRSRG